MSSIVDDSDVCPVCKKGRLVKRDDAIEFLQWTDKGPIRCRAVIPIAVCSRCGFKSWDEAAEAVLDEAVRREYEKLPDRH